MTAILVTGGAGFIGSAIVDRLLAEGHRVAVVDDFSSGRAANLADAEATGRLSVHTLDIRSADLGAVFDKERPEIVIHMAAQIDVRVSVRDPVLDAEVNIVGTLNVAERARESGARRILVASSGGCIYGEGTSLPLREDDPGQPVSPYGISKRALHAYLPFYKAQHGIEYALLALGNVYGPRQDPHGEAGVVAIFLRAMLDERPTVIYGDGRQTRDFVFVDDVASAFLAALDRGEGVYNIGTGLETDVVALWDSCARATGFRGEPRHEPERPGELRRSALDASRAARDLGWTPTVTLDEGIARTAEWIARA